MTIAELMAGRGLDAAPPAVSVEARALLASEDAIKAVDRARHNTER